MSSTAVVETQTRRKTPETAGPALDQCRRPDDLVDRPVPGAMANETIAFTLVLACFVLSGFAALLYETAWFRQFAIVFGTSELALATVLSAYMAGLALGAALAGQFAHRIRKPVLAYGILELGIAGGALLVPVGLKLARYVHVLWLGGQPDLSNAGLWTHAVFYFASSFCIILVPTTLMGATLPLLARHAIVRMDQIGSRISWLYSMNTAGAVLGTLTAAYLLLPVLGLQGTVFVGVMTNAIVFGIAWWISRMVVSSTTEADQATMTPLGNEERSVSIESADPHLLALAARQEGDLNRWCAMILPVIAVSGFASFTYEILWTRLLGHILGGSLFAFSAMLASFLMGIALGSAIVSRWAQRRRQAVIGFSIAQLGTALLSLLIYHALDQLPAMAAWLESGEHAGFFRNSAIAIVVLLPATLCIGATFPFAVRILARDAGDASVSAARVYAWNTCGAIVGAIVAGTWLLPVLEFSGTAALAVSINLLLALVVCGVFRRVSLKPLYGVGAVAVALILVPPRGPHRVLTMSPFTSKPSAGRTVFSRVGRSTTVLLQEKDGFFTMRNNGLPEAGIAPKGAPPGSWESHRWLAALPVLARPETESMLIVGLGGGVTVAGVPSSVKAIDVIELEPEVVEANRAIAKLRLKDPLDDARVRVIMNDARGALSLTTKRYDAIVSQPSHPWTAGASHLYTREFLQLARNHLNDDGVYLQWMNAEMLDETLLHTVGATLLDVFQHVRLYRPDPETLLFLGSNAPLDVEDGVTHTDILTTAAATYQWLGLNSVEDVAAALALESAGVRALCAGAPVNTDDNNRLATRTPLVLSHPLGERIDALLAPFDPLINADSELNADDQIQLDRVYLVRRLALMHLWERADRVAGSIDDYAEQLLARGVIQSKAGESVAAADSFQKAFTLNPTDAQTRFKVIESSLARIAAGTADRNLLAVAAGLSGPAAAVVAAARYHYQGDARRLSRLDAMLAEVKPTSLYFPLASYFRAYWRAKVTAPQFQQFYAEEALKLVDRGLACNPSVFGALVRINAAAATGQPETLVESADYAAKLFETQPVARRTIESTAKTVFQQLDRLSQDSRVPEYRIDEVRQRYETLLDGKDATNHNLDDT